MFSIKLQINPLDFSIFANSCMVSSSGSCTNYTFNHKYILLKRKISPVLLLFSLINLFL